jgi:hypothetical protein
MWHPAQTIRMAWADRGDRLVLKDSWTRGGRESAADLAGSGAADQHAGPARYAGAKPITWAQQRILLPKLSAHAAEMALFVLNTGARDAAACSPRWDWEVRSPDQRYSIFVVPKDAVINGKGKVRDAVKGRRPTTTRWHRSTSWWTRWNSLPTSTAG